jgi:hypothetical protein
MRKNFSGQALRCGGGKNVTEVKKVTMASGETFVTV